MQKALCFWQCHIQMIPYQKVVTKCVMNLAWKSVPGNQCGGSLARIVQLLHCGQGFLQRPIHRLLLLERLGGQLPHATPVSFQEGPGTKLPTASSSQRLEEFRTNLRRSCCFMLFLVNWVHWVHLGVNHFSKVEADSLFTSQSLQRISPGRPLQSSLSPGMIDDLTIFDHLKLVWAILAVIPVISYYSCWIGWIEREISLFLGLGKWNRVEFFQRSKDGKESWLFAGVSEHWKLKTQVFLSVDLWGLRIQAWKMPTPNKIKQATLLSALFPDPVCKKYF